MIKFNNNFRLKIEKKFGKTIQSMLVYPLVFFMLFPVDLFETGSARAAGYTNKKIERASGNNKHGKIQAPVELTWSAPKTSKPNEVATIYVSAKPATDVDNLTLIIQLPAHITLVKGKTTLDAGSVKAGKVVSNTIQVKTLKTGRHSFALLGKIKVGQQTMSGITGIVLSVGVPP